ncbi:hypothetical protein N6H14_13980 [Paenibacillus sp. CC-CFT747]|nr:hypothetical protein N6H14_13980 [Paenibacillus sp. CC-CFT747]
MSLPSSPTAAVREQLQSASDYLLLFYLWGAEWMVSALLELSPYWSAPAWLRFVPPTAALAASLFVIWRGAGRKRPKPAPSSEPLPAHRGWWILPFSCSSEGCF